ncbi:alpha/beta hydrolase [Salinisphaera sp. Q1T1-3]|nr:alpha/beta hydrolase [Salinisphaera sp. Q1T1-3]
MACAGCATQGGARDAAGANDLTATPGKTSATAADSRESDDDRAAVAPYPIDNPLLATVLGTPAKLKAPLPDDAPITLRTLDPLVQRDTPDTLRYARPLQYMFTPQDGPAPLAFVIAGTGASALSSKCVLLSRALYADGYSVACLPSPTSVTFMLGAAEYPVPGRMKTDVDDLYRMMGAVRDDLSDQIDITGYALTGWSLGATEAAFVAHKDASAGQFDFQHVLLLNPAVSVWDSVARMDALLDRTLPGGIDQVPSFLAKGLGGLKDVYAKNKALRFNEDFLYQAYQSGAADQNDIGALVGLAFRLSLANMAYAADVITRSDVIVPKNVTPGPYSDMRPYFRRAFDMSFNDYINELLVPYWNSDGRHVPKSTLIREADLHQIAGFLANSDNIAVFTNADDPILSDDEVAFLSRTFGARARIRPHGGHMGNLSYDKTIRALQDFFSP